MDVKPNNQVVSLDDVVLRNKEDIKQYRHGSCPFVIIKNVPINIALAEPQESFRNRMLCVKN
jgi:hypothetical protein